MYQDKFYVLDSEDSENEELHGKTIKKEKLEASKVSGKFNGIVQKRWQPQEEKEEEEEDDDEDLSEPEED